jgi:integrase
MSRQQRPTVYPREHTANLWIRFYDETGHLVRRSAKTEDEREAWKELERCLKEVEQKRDLHSPLAEGMTLFMKSKTFRPGTLRQYPVSSDHWISFCDENRIEHFVQLTKLRVAEFIAWRKTRGVVRRDVRFDITDATIRRDLAFLSSCWNFLLEDPRWEQRMPPCPISRRIMRSLKESRLRNRVATPEEWRALMAATTGDYQRHILTVAVETGLRHQELCQLIWPLVDLESRQIVLDPDLVVVKNDRGRLIPLSEVAVRALAGTPRNDQTQFVFWYLDRKKRPQPFASMANWFQAVRRRSGVRNFRFHDIRHTFATHHLNQGGTRDGVKRILGHSSLAVGERYATLTDASLTQEIRNKDKRRSLPETNRHIR